MSRILLLLVLALTLGTAAPQSDLESGFRNPPMAARLRCYWWWLNGNTSPSAITRDLEQMKAKGYGGAIIIDAGGAEQRGNDQVPAGPLFGGPEWRKLFRHALAEADRLGLELSLNILSGWNLGGPMVTPEQSAKLVTWSAIQVKGPAAFDVPLAQPLAKFDYYRDIAVLAYPLHHGAPLPGKDGRKAIRQLTFKAVFREAGFSTPETTPLLDDEPEVAGEQDTLPGEVIDLTSRMSGGRLRWDVPAGDWEILRFGYTPSGSVVSTSSGKWQGLVIDYIDRGALEKYWGQVMEPVLADAKPYIGKSLKYLVTDSWELDGVNWTPKFRDEFRTRRGYDILPYLPVYTGRIVGSRGESNRFLNDLRKTVGDLVADRHYSAFAELSRKYGLGIHPEAGGPHGAPVDALQALGRTDFPQMEFWAKSPTHRVADSDRFFVKEASSAAHIYGKTLVGAEAFTSIGPHWEETIWDNLKPTLDRALCEGLNLLIWHTFTSSPKELGVPGQEYFAGTHMNPNITWWEQAPAFFNYINRSSFLLQRGRIAADVLYYYGDHVPNFVRLKSSDPAKVLPGYDYDVVNEEVLLTRAAVRDGRIVLPDGVSYRILVLQQRENMSPAVLRKIRQLIADGATVVGPKPSRATGRLGDNEVRRLADEVWGDCSTERKFGKGTVVCGKPAREVLAAAGVKPDVEIKGVEPSKWDFIHRTDRRAEIYFLSSQQPEPVEALAVFRLTGKTPEFWQGATGEIRPVAFYRTTADGRTEVPVKLEPYGSLFVVFRRPAENHVVSLSRDGQPVLFADVRAGDGQWRVQTDSPGKYEAVDLEGNRRSVAVAQLPAPQEIDGPWTVRFAPGWGAPASLQFPQLRSYTESDDPGVKYFSGTAVYEKDIDIPADRLGPGKLLRLDLGDVRMLAEVKLNGRDLGVLWRKPFDVDITGVARPGRNRLEVRVTNLWPNRLIGDQQLPESQRKTWTNVRKFKKDSPLMPSGLLGPARLVSGAAAAFR